MPREVTVRPVRDAQKRRRWDALVSEFHSLAFRALFGQSLRHVAVHGSVWVALVGWTAGAFKVGARDRWVGWAPARQFRRLGLVANNSRFVMLTGKGEAGNLASRVLGLSLRRLSRDMCAAYGHPVLVAETFVDPSRFAGTCYRASNWRMLGVTRGFTRLPGGAARWRENGQPKEVYTSSRNCRRTRSTRRCAPGAGSTAAAAALPWTARMCVAPRNRLRTESG